MATYSMFRTDVASILPRRYPQEMPAPTHIASHASWWSGVYDWLAVQILRPVRQVPFPQNPEGDHLATSFGS